MQFTIPEFIKPHLWSYKTEELKGDHGAMLVVTAVLNYGDRKAVSWLFSTFPEEFIKQAVAQPLRGQWDKKSLRYWSLILDLEYNSAGTAVWR